MRKREVGGYEPDDAEQAELVELWHLSRTALAGQLSGNTCDREARIRWCVDQFLDKHQHTPNVAGKWVHNWAVNNLGLLTRDLREYPR